MDTGLDRAEKLMALGTRNFFLCPKKLGAETSSSSRCKKEAQTEISVDLPWPKFMDFML